jgi:hypothetical protein
MAWFALVVRVSMAIVIIFFCVTFVGLMITCKPFDTNWNVWYEGGHFTMSQGDRFVFSGAFNLALDVLLAVLPIPVVWTLIIFKLKRIVVCTMFGLGLLSVLPDPRPERSK